MSRIKYKAFHKETEAMYKVAMIDFDEDEVKLYYFNDDGPVYASLQKVILLQYLNRNDDKGVEICEDDIIRIYTWRDEDDRSLDAYTDHIVEYGKLDYPGFDLWPILTDSCNGLQAMEHDEAFVWYEVIGNKHENPRMTKALQ